jgi:transposase
VVGAHTTRSRCPVCSAPSSRVHSRSVRQVAELPWLEIAVRLRRQVRRFLCDQPDCPRAICTERLAEVPEVVEPYARRPLRLSRLVALVGFLLGGSAGSRLLRQLVSAKVAPRRDTILRAIRRAIRRTILPSPHVVEPLSVDDLAFRRGTT